MSGSRAERTAVFVLRQLAVGFAVVGILFVATPDGVVHTIDDLGDQIGSFAHGPATHEKLWLALAFAYMTVITGIAVVVSDRKSTRLNSSHLVTSYAVFCLKKKN